MKRETVSINPTWVPPRWTPIRSTRSLSQKCRAEQAVLEMRNLSMWQKPVHPSLSLEWEWESKDSCSFVELLGSSWKWAFWEHIPGVQSSEARDRHLGKQQAKKNSALSECMQEQNEVGARVKVLEWNSWQLAQLSEVFPSL